LLNKSLSVQLSSENFTTSNLVIRNHHHKRVCKSQIKPQANKFFIILTHCKSLCFWSGMLISLALSKRVLIQAADEFVASHQKLQNRRRSHYNNLGRTYQRRARNHFLAECVATDKAKYAWERERMFEAHSLLDARPLQLQKQFSQLSERVFRAPVVVHVLERVSRNVRVGWNLVREAQAWLWCSSNELTEQTKTGSAEFFSLWWFCCEIVPAFPAYLKERGAEMVMKKLKFPGTLCILCPREKLLSFFICVDALRVGKCKCTVYDDAEAMPLYCNLNGNCVWAKQ